MEKFIEKLNEKQNQRRKRFLKFLRELPKSEDQYFDNKKKIWVLKEQ